VPSASEPRAAATRVEAPEFQGRTRPSQPPIPGVTPIQSPAVSQAGGGRHKAIFEAEVLGTSRAASVDVSWGSQDPEGHQETLSERKQTGSDNVATFTVVWSGAPSTRISVQAFDDRGRKCALDAPLKAGAILRQRFQLPVTPILEVRKPAADGLAMQGIVRIYVEEELIEAPGVFAGEGDVAVFSPTTRGRCRVVVRARLFAKDGELVSWVYGEQDVELEPGVRTLVTPAYVAMARVRVRVLRPDGTPLSASQVSLRCGEGPSHECQRDHHGEHEQNFGFVDDEIGPQTVSPGPLLEGSAGGEEVFLRPGTYQVLASGNDPRLARGQARVTLEPGARKTLEVRLPLGLETEVRLPEPTPEELLTVVLEGPPGASAHVNASGVLLVRGLLESDSLRVSVSRSDDERVWGEQVILRAGARHTVRMVRAGRLELRLRRPDGSQIDWDGRVVPETPAGLGRYRRVLTDDEVGEAKWFVGDEVGHYGRVEHPVVSSILDSDQDNEVSWFQVLPGEHWIEIEAPEGVIRIPVKVREEETVRVDRVLK